jgi:2-hydroxychromene-2-carboxylate isomerase
MIEFWFDFGSNYSYLSMMRIDALTAQRGVTVAWRPFLLAPIFKSLGWETSPFVLQEAKGRYVWQDMERRAQRYGLPWRKPTHFPRRALLPARVAVLSAEQPWVGEFCKRIMQLNFVEDRDIDNIEAVGSVLEHLGQPSQAIIDEAQSDTNKTRLREQTDVAAARGIFGAPTFFVGDEMFWGDDRLEDALTFAKKTDA